MPKSSSPAVEAMLHSVYDQPDVTSAHAHYDKLLNDVAAKLPDVRDRLDAALGEVLAGQHDQGAEGRRYLGLDMLASRTARPGTTPAEEQSSDPFQALTA